MKKGRENPHERVIFETNLEGPPVVNDLTAPGSVRVTGDKSHALKKVAEFVSAKPIWVLTICSVCGSIRGAAGG
jgi:hypothetical protein